MGADLAARLSEGLGQETFMESHQKLRQDKSTTLWQWLGLAALAGMVIALPLTLRRRRHRSYSHSEELMDAYVRGCLAEERQQHPQG